MNFSLGHKNTIASTQQFLFYSEKTGTQTFAALRPSECEELSGKGSKRIFRRDNGARFVEPFEKCVIHHHWIQSQAQKHARIPERIFCADHGTYIDSVLREIYDAYEAARSTSSHCGGGLADRVPKRQPDLATRMMLEQASFSSNCGDYEQSTILQLSLGCIDRAVESITKFVSVRERSTHSEDDITLSLRDVDSTADDGVWAILDDGCNSCSRSKAWRQNAEAKMKVFGLHPISLHKKATTFNGTGRSTKNRKPKIPIGHYF